jgi:hypothetical protein
VLLEIIYHNTVHVWQNARAIYYHTNGRQSWGIVGRLT